MKNAMTRKSTALKPAIRHRRSQNARLVAAPEAITVVVALMKTSPFQRLAARLRATLPATRSLSRGRAGARALRGGLEDHRRHGLRLRDQRNVARLELGGRRLHPLREETLLVGRDRLVERRNDVPGR